MERTGDVRAALHGSRVARWVDVHAGHGRWEPVGALPPTLPAFAVEGGPRVGGARRGGFAEGPDPPGRCRSVPSPTDPGERVPSSDPPRTAARTPLPSPRLGLQRSVRALWAFRIAAARRSAVLVDPVRVARHAVDGLLTREGRTRLLPGARAGFRTPLSPCRGGEVKSQWTDSSDRIRSTSRPSPSRTAAPIPPGPRATPNRLKPRRTDLRFPKDPPRPPSGRGRPPVWVLLGRCYGPAGMRTRAALTGPAAQAYPRRAPAPCLRASPPEALRPRLAVTVPSSESYGRRSALLLVKHIYV